MDTEPLETNVYVHSPIIEYSAEGGYYTSYAIHLTSNNPCFSRPNSHIRRRYSEFVRVRELLSYHHPTLTLPDLPPKSYFHRFNDDFIDQRMKGLQNFLKKLLSTPVYLSDKSLHLFLQSTSSMSRINKECLGDIPAPPLIESCVFSSSHSENRIKNSTLNQEQQYARSLHHLVLEDCKIEILTQRTDTRTTEIQIPPSVQQSSGCCDSLVSLNRNERKPFLIPQKNGSLNSSTASSPSSSPSPSSKNNSYSLCSERSKERRVSFNERVKVAVVTHYGIAVLRP